MHLQLYEYEKINNKSYHGEIKNYCVSEGINEENLKTEVNQVTKENNKLTCFWKKIYNVSINFFHKYSHGSVELLYQNGKRYSNLIGK